MNEIVEMLLNDLLAVKQEVKRLNSIIEQASQDVGDGPIPSALYKETGVMPQYEVRIDNLLREIEKRDIWLEQRKDEIASLHNALQNKNSVIERLKKGQHESSNQSPTM